MKKTLTILMMVLLLAMLVISCDSPKNEPKYKVGDRGPAGGIIFYVAESEETTTYYDETMKWRYLEAAPDDAPVGTESTMYQWCTEFTQAPSNLDVEFGSGWLNTKHILSDSTRAAYFPAILACKEYGKGTKYDDWYLPSKAELDEMYKNKSFITDLQDAKYCSSTTNASAAIYSVSFADGSGNYEQYNSSYYVRPIRAFSD